MNARLNRLDMPDWPLSPGLAQLPAEFYSNVAPTPLPEPYWVAQSEAAAQLIGLDPASFNTPAGLAILAGNAPFPQSSPLATVYSGHQFGVWAGQLGDGRAHLIATVVHQQQRWEIQLKGSGQTPYSRGGDGRAVLRSSIREFLASEAMAGLGIPTTRALAVVGSPAWVQREQSETAAVVTRLAPSFIRFGSFEHWRKRGNSAALRTLADHVIHHFRPELAADPQPYLALLGDVAHRTGELIADWTAVGFMHGVMNSDNMSILGLTLDYGPFGFMEAYDQNHICNHSDHQGRYRYCNQAAIAHWNLYRLGDALLPLLNGVEQAKAAINQSFPTAFEQRLQQRLRHKLGFAAALPGDETFFSDTFAFLQQHRPDFTQFFRALCQLPNHAQQPSDDAPVLDCFIDRAAAAHWLQQWRARLQQTPWAEQARQQDMRNHNPKYILRNWLAEHAIRQAQQGDLTTVSRVLACLQHPFAEQPEYAAYAALPPDWANGLTVSCSS
jgi:uncharacterized protein YdiU (UPF0061 family)